MAVEKDLVALESATARRAGHGPHPCQGLYHRPSGERPRVACIAAHYNVDFSEHYLAEPLAERGIGFLGWNTRYRGDEAHFLLEHALVDIGSGVRWLREVAGAEVVVILGNSGGGSLMGAYQSQAVEPSIAPAPGLHLPEAVTELPAGDLYISLNAHPGRPEVLTAWLDPSVTDEADPLSVDPDLDPSDRRVGCYAGDPAAANRGPWTLGGSCTLRTWLSMWSLEESQCRGAPHLARITVPALVVQSTADRGVFPSDARAVHDALAAPDKALAFLPGEHYFETGGLDQVVDLLAAWIAERT